MGGHGGLNILPQKSWNVYGYHERKRVERDEERAQQRRERTEKRELDSESQQRIELLRRQRGLTDAQNVGSGSNNGDGTATTENQEITVEFPTSFSDKRHRTVKYASQDEKKKVKKEKIFKSKKDRDVEKRAQNEQSVNENALLDKQEDEETPKHLNFFSKEEELNKDKEELALRMEREKDFFKDKPYDLTSKFMGNLTEKRNEPWYLESRAEKAQVQQTIAQKSEENKIESVRARSRSRSQERKKDLSKEQKLEKLREERLKREHRERKRQQKLIHSHYILGK